MNVYKVMEMVALLVENFLIIKFYIDFFSLKQKNIKSYIYVFLIFVLICIAGTVSVNLGMTSDYGILIAMFFMIIFGYYCLNGTMINKIIFSICIFVIIAVISILTLQTLNMTLKIPLTELIDIEGKYRIIVLFITKILFYILLKTVLIATKKQEFQLTLQEWLTCVFVVIITLVMLVMIYKIMYTIQVSTVARYLVIIFSALLVFIDILIYGMVLKLSKSNREKIRYKLMENQIEQQEEILSSIMSSNDKIRQVKHDLKNYLMTTIGLIDNQEYDKARMYMNNLLDQDIDKIETFITTSSRSLSALLNIKLDLCHKKDIKWNVEITSDLNIISDIDFNIIIGNLFDNAIEASVQVSNNPFIDIIIFDNKKYINIIFKNRIHKSVLLGNPNLFTTKKDKSSHGIGLLSVKKIVKKYNGMYHVSEENDVFVVNIALSID